MTKNYGKDDLEYLSQCLFTHRPDEFKDIDYVAYRMGFHIAYVSQGSFEKILRDRDDKGTSVTLDKAEGENNESTTDKQ